MSIIIKQTIPIESLDSNDLFTSDTTKIRIGHINSSSNIYESLHKLINKITTMTHIPLNLKKWIYIGTSNYLFCFCTIRHCSIGHYKFFPYSLIYNKTNYEKEIHTNLYLKCCPLMTNFMLEIVLSNRNKARDSFSGFSPDNRLTYQTPRTEPQNSTKLVYTYKERQ